MAPGCTRHVSKVPAGVPLSLAQVSTSAPASRSMPTVMAICGADGARPPRCRISAPLSNRGAASSSPDTSCEEPDASMVTGPPRTAPAPCTVNGSAPRPPSSISTPRWRKAARSGAIGRLRAYGSPSIATSPFASAATGGRNRITVPASPTFTCAGPASSPGSTCQSSPSSPMPAPRSRRPSAISPVSRLCSGRWTHTGSAASAARMSARLVMDLEPGSSTVASTGAGATGADQCEVGMSQGYRPARAASGITWGRAITGGWSAASRLRRASPRSG
jgi:hypothetical protein